MRVVVVPDLQRVAVALLHALPGVAGPGTALPSGAHTGARRSTARGAACRVQLVSTPGDIDVEGPVTGRVSFRCSAVGSEDAAHAQASAAAGRVAAALAGVTAPVTVLVDGAPVRVVFVSAVTVPVQTGDIDGEVAYSTDATLHAVV